MWNTPRPWFTPVCFTPFVLLTPPTNWHQLMYAFSFPVERPLAGLFPFIWVCFILLYHFLFMPTFSGTQLGRKTRLWYMVVATCTTRVWFLVKTWIPITYSVKTLLLWPNGVHGYEGALSAGSEWLDWKLSISFSSTPTQGRIKLFGAPRQWKHFRPLFQAVFLSGGEVLPPQTVKHHASQSQDRNNKYFILYIEFCISNKILNVTFL